MHALSAHLDLRTCGQAAFLMLAFTEPEGEPLPSTPQPSPQLTPQLYDVTPAGTLPAYKLVGRTMQVRTGEELMASRSHRSSSMAVSRTDQPTHYVYTHSHSHSHTHTHTHAHTRTRSSTRSSACTCTCTCCACTLCRWRSLSQLPHTSPGPSTCTPLLALSSPSACMVLRHTPGRCCPKGQLTNSVCRWMRTCTLP